MPVWQGGLPRGAWSGNAELITVRGRGRPAGHVRACSFGASVAIGRAERKVMTIRSGLFDGAGEGRPRQEV